jgi:DNA end-binding protein Ku
MPRSIWNGTISIGPVHVPVKVFTLVEDKTVSFRQVHAKDGGKIEHRRFCSQEDREVPYEEVVKGYELGDGTYVVLEGTEVKAAAGARTKIIEVEHFVPAADVDPVVFGKPYALGAREEGSTAYRVLVEALERTGRLAIGRWVFHDRERLVGIGVRDGLLHLHVLRFAEEVVQPGDVDLDAPKKAPGDREVDMAGRLVESLHRDFELDQLHDEHRDEVLALIERKRKGETIEAPEVAPPEESDDLLAALEASLAGAKR